MSTCSVVMVSYFTGPVLFASIKSVLKQPGLAELIVVDNGNPPAVLSRLQQMTLNEPRLIIQTGGGNVGFAKACNAGSERATGKFLLLLNPDCLLPPEALTDMMAAFDEVEGAKLAGCWLQNPDGSEQRGGRRRLLNPKTALIEALGLHRLYKGASRLNQHETVMPRETHEVEAISGAFMCIRMRDFRDMGGLDEGFFLHVEDLDFCMRIQKSGGKIICVPRVQVTHMLSTSGETTSRFIEWHKTKGFIRYFTKHFKESPKPLLWMIQAAAYTRFGLKMLFTKRGGTQRKLVHTRAAKRLMALAMGFADLPERKEWHGKTVLVTGATSQIGLCVVRRMLASGASVLALSRGEPIPFRHDRLRWIKGDLTDPNLSLQGYLVDVAVHAAPLWHFPKTIATLERAETKRVVAFGSTSVFGKALSRNAYEKELVEKLAKAELETARKCEERGIQWTILRPTLVYGLGLDVNVTSIARFIDRYGFFPVYPPAFGRRQPVHADDLGAAALQAASSPGAINKSYNLSGGRIITYREMVEAIFAVCQRPVRIIPTTLMPFLMDMAGIILGKKHLNGEIARRMNEDLVFFHDDATKDFGFHARPFLSGGMKDLEGF